MRNGESDSPQNPGLVDDPDVGVDSNVETESDTEAESDESELDFVSTWDIFHYRYEPS